MMRRGIVTVPATRLRHGPVVQRWEDNADLLKYGVGALVHGLLDVIVDGHFDAVQALDDAMEDLEDHLFDEEARSARTSSARTYRVRKDLVELRRVVLPMREVVNAVLRHRKRHQRPHRARLLVRRPIRPVLRATEWTESLRDMVATMFETNLSLADARLNTVMKKLTGWAAIIAVPTAITGYFGQQHPLPRSGSSHWGFLLSLTIMISIATGLYLTFRHKGWI